ncbi:hypothetical protein CSKR_106693 [Clonorchis sinensis]|uniref:Uncharacterized protein n=1 Tax=Clonorchis sinensis TaxID=79923 RepID=A0A3R7GPC0_CLOSI|nr:hypothetical protein CSKR_106693 [Clonorchis sinensis]
MRELKEFSHVRCAQFEHYVSQGVLQHISNNELFIKETPTQQLQTIGQGSKTLICILFTKLNVYLILERVLLNFPRYLLTVTQMQVNATKRLHKFPNRSQFSRDKKRIYKKTYYSHASSVVSTATLVANVDR